VPIGYHDSNVRTQLKSRIAAMAFIALGFSLSSAYAKDPALLSLTMEHFRDTATAKDNPSDDTTTISTENGFVEHSGPMRMVWHDEYLKGVIDKKTNRKSFQVYSLVIYTGDFRSYKSVKYSTANGPQSIPVIRLSSESANCAVTACTYTEHIVFPVDEALLRELAAGYVPGKPAIWSYKLSAKSGPDYSVGLSNAEIAGFLAKVDESSNARPLVKAGESGNALPFANANVVARASLKVDLGIEGLAVDATADQPNRAGILVIAVNRGSVAQKSGIIIGDILHEFEGRPLKTPADLQTAVAGHSANSVVVIKLYRGIADMAVTAQF
jgi:hypothetical protein